MRCRACAIWHSRPTTPPDRHRTPSAIATQASRSKAALLSLANTQDGSGNYIFAGYSTQTQPFALTATGASYAGDQGQRQVQIAAGQTVGVGDNGDLVFNQIKTGNGTFTVTAAAGQHRLGIIGATTVTDPAGLRRRYLLDQIHGPTTYQVVNTATNAVVTSGTYTTGQAIAFSGVQVTLIGATGRRRFVHRRAEHAIRACSRRCRTSSTALQQSTPTRRQAQLNNSIAGAINNIDQALNHADVQSASAGG